MLVHERLTLAGTPSKRRSTAEDRSYLNRLTKHCPGTQPPDSLILGLGDSQASRASAISGVGYLSPSPLSTVLPLTKASATAGSGAPRHTVGVSIPWQLSMLKLVLHTRAWLESRWALAGILCDAPFPLMPCLKV